MESARPAPPDFSKLATLNSQLPPLPNHFKVHELLSPAELAELEAFAREPGRTVDECHDWLLERSFALSRGAVGNWLADFRERTAVDRMRAGGGLAAAVMAAAKVSGGLAVHDAAILQVGQAIFERTTMGDVDTDELNKMSLALQRLSLSKKRVEEVRDEYIKREREAVDAAEAAVKAGGDARSVVDKVRTVLGLGSKGGA